MSERENPTGKGSDQKRGLSRRQFLSQGLLVGGALTMVGVGFGSIAEGALSASRQASAEQPLPVSRGEYREITQRLEESNKRIVKAADERRYGDISAIREAPERIEAESVAGPYEEAFERQDQRRQELVDERFSLGHPVTRVELAIVAGGALAYMVGLVLLRRPRQDHQEQSSTGSVETA